LSKQAEAGSLIVLLFKFIDSIVWWTDEHVMESEDQAGSGHGQKAVMVQ
jgi:hypothetical protein